jgi:DNA modification methylase
MVVAYERPPTLAELMVLCKICGSKGCTKDHRAERGDLAPEDLRALDLEALGRLLQERWGGIEQLGHKSQHSAFSLGLVLEAARGQAPKGRWLKWVDEQGGPSRRTAQRYIEFRELVTTRERLDELQEGGDLDPTWGVGECVARLKPTKANRPAQPPRIFPVATPRDIDIRQLDAAKPPIEWCGTVDLLVTSWPYGIGQDAHGYVDVSDYASWLESVGRWALALEDLLAPNGRAVINLPLDVRKSGVPRPVAADALNILLDGDLRYQTTILWLKAVNGQNSRSNARGSATPPHPTPNAPCVTTGTEVLLVVHKGDWSLDRTGEPSDLAEHEALEWTNGVWIITGASDKRYPHVFPEDLVGRCLKLFSFPGAVVADLHCGSGTTAAVAATLGRKFVGGDKNPFAVALATQRVAEALNGARGGQ